MKFELKKIRWQNAFIFNGTFEVNFPETGAFLLEGRNLDAGGSNGSGKTSFLNLIPTVLFEENNSGLIKDKIINANSKDAFIELFINDYRILYQRGSENKWSVFKNGTVFNREKITDTKEIIKELFGLDFRRYASIIHLCQNSTLGFFSFSPTERLRLLTEILELERFDRASDKSREKMVGSKERVEGLRQRLTEIETERQRILEQIKGLLIVRDDLDTLKRKRDSIDYEIEQMKQVLLQQNEDMVQKRMLYEASLRSRQEYQIQIEQKNRRIMQLRQKQNEYEGLVQRIEYLEGLQSNVTDLEKEEELKDDLAVLMDKKLDFSKEIERLREQKRQLEKIINLEIGNDCPVCGRVLTEEIIHKRRKHLQEELKQKDKEILAKEGEITKIDQELDRIRDKHKRLEEQRKKNQKILSEILQLRKELEGLSGINSEIKILEQDLEILQNQLNEVNNKFEAERVAFIESQERMNEIKQKIDFLSMEQKEILNRIVFYERQMEIREQCERRLDELKLRYDELLQQIKEGEMDVAVYDWLQDAFKKIKLFEIEHTINLLQNYLNYYIELLFENRMTVQLDVFKFKKQKKSAFDLKNELNITINNSVVSLEGFSGGEKQLLSIAMLLALNDFFGYKIVLLDEVFGSLDTVNRERVIRLLNGLRHKKLVIVVTHIEDVKSALDWDGVLLVERKDNCSRFISQVA